VYCYNLLGLQRFKVAGEAPIPAGEHQIRMEFTYDGGGPASGARRRSSSTGCRWPRAGSSGPQPLIFSLDETTDVGSDSATPVSDDYTSVASRFTGRVRWVQIDLDDAAHDADHYVSPEDRMRVAMARQ